MPSSAAQFISIANQYATVGFQAAQALNTQQQSLALDQVLSQSRLQTTDGTSASLTAIEQLRTLIGVHQAAFEKIVVSASSELLSAVAEVPESLRSEYKTGLLHSVNWQLSAQSAFYEGRLRWADAATRLCDLVESRRAELVFSEHGVEFQSNDDIEEFNALLTTIEEVHQLEVAALQERATKFAASTAILSAVQRT
ncbi:MAG: hypothetical protein IPQ22_03150 [Rhodoferax sp.]|nr:hypothetical protein [Rhodoferax sp.]